LSLGCDEVPLFWGRSPVDMYRDFMDAFANAFQHMFGTVITEITVGLGPAGELRYPSYPEGDARCVLWRAAVCLVCLAWVCLALTLIYTVHMLIIIIKYVIHSYTLYMNE
jgi:hypothetical protein